MTFGGSSSLNVSRENVCVFLSLSLSLSFNVGDGRYDSRQPSIRSWRYGARRVAIKRAQLFCREWKWERDFLHTQVLNCTCCHSKGGANFLWSAHLFLIFFSLFLVFCFMLMLSYEHWTYKVDTRELLSNNFNSACVKNGYRNIAFVSHCNESHGIRLVRDAISNWLWIIWWTLNFIRGIWLGTRLRHCIAGEAFKNSNEEKILYSGL